MAAITSFYPYVVPHVPGCPSLTVDVAIRSAIIEFCERSLLLQRDHDPLSVTSNIADYDFEPPIANHLVVKIMRAWFKGNQLVPIAPDEINNPTIYNVRATASPLKGDPRNIFQKDERTFTLYPIPSETVKLSLTMRVALKPSRTAATVEDVLFEDHAETIGAGALSKLMMQAGKPYANPQVSAIHLKVFESGINAAKQAASRGHVRSALRVKIPTI